MKKPMPCVKGKCKIKPQRDTTILPLKRLKLKQTNKPYNTKNVKCTRYKYQ